MHALRQLIDVLGWHAWIWLLKTFFRRCCKVQWRRSHLAVTVGDIILSYKTSYTRCMPVGGYGNCELWGPEFCTPRCASGFWGTSYVSGIWNCILNISKPVHLVLLGFVFYQIPYRLTYPLFLFLWSTMTAKVSRKCQRMHSGLFLYLFLSSTLFSTNEQAFRCTASKASFHHLWLHKWLEVGSICSTILLEIKRCFELFWDILRYLEMFWVVLSCKEL